MVHVYPEHNIKIQYYGRITFLKQDLALNPTSGIYIYIYIYIYMFIYIYLKLLYIDIKSSSSIHEFYTSKCIHILRQFISGYQDLFTFFLLYYHVSDDYAYRTCDMAIIWKSVILYNDFKPALCILCMHMYVLPNLILHGLNTPRILHGLNTSRTIRSLYISGYIFVLCCF